MGMDAYLVRCRNQKQVETEGFWDKCIDLRHYEAWEDDEFNSPAELWYGRKFWKLHEAVFPEYNGDMSGQWVEVDKARLEKMVDFAARNPSYFGNFNTVAELCQALFSYDRARENGFIYMYECDW